MRTPMPNVTNAGLYQAITDTNSTDAIAVPDGAQAVILWFETASNDSTIIRGRVGISDSSTSIESLTGTDTKLGYHPAMPVEYDLNRHQRRDGSGVAWNTLYVHVASTTSGAVVRGMWLY